MKKDFPNVVTKNVLTNEEYQEVYDLVANSTNVAFQDALSYNMFHIELPEHIISKLTEIAENISGVKVKRPEYNVSRYEMVQSNCGKTYTPLLYPHTDDAFIVPKITLDLQLRANVSWDIAVDNWESVTSYTLSDNEMLSFSGTHQVHWRPKREFKQGEFLDMMFLHFEPIDGETLSSAHINEMKDRAGMRHLEWHQTPGVGFNVGTEESQFKKYKAV